MFIEPTREQMKELSAQAGTEGPVVMINLLKFKPDGGRESYDRYGRAVLPLVKKLGGRQVYYGRQTMAFIGRDDWDLVLLVEYPSVKAFLDMLASPEYQAATRFKTEALTDSRLYVTRPGP